jgi:DNA-binding CsgD family transcriptional regulator
MATSTGGSIDLAARRFGSSIGTSTRETEVLRLLAMGYGRKAIAGILDLSASTIDVFTSRTRKKAGAASNFDLVYRVLLTAAVIDSQTERLLKAECVPSEGSAEASAAPLTRPPPSGVQPALRRGLVQVAEPKP